MFIELAYPYENTLRNASITEDKMALGAHNSLRLLEAVKADTWREGTGRPPPPGLATKPGTPPGPPLET